MGGIRVNKKPFKSAILKGKLSHSDKTDPNSIKFPEFIDQLDDEKLYSLVERIVKKYKDNYYFHLDREELDEKKDWSDLYILVLANFYKRGWRYIIENEKGYFPHFVFTYNPIPLKKEVDKIITRIYDKTDSELSKDELDNLFSYSSLDITYLLHYLTITHFLYKEKNDKD